MSSEAKTFKQVRELAPLIGLAVRAAPIVVKGLNKAGPQIGATLSSIPTAIDKAKSYIDKKRNKKESFKKFRTEMIDDTCENCNIYEDLEITEAEYDGRKVKLNDPIRTSENPNKKFKVYTMGPNGKVVVVRFGDPNMEIKRDDPARRKSFRARHNCDNPGPKYKARYWSCYQWRANAPVDEDYFKGLGKGTVAKRKAHFNKHGKKDDDDPSAYKKAPGDARAKTKLSKHTKAVRKKFPEIYEDATASLKKKAEKTGMPLGILRQVFNRGKAAWKTGHRPGTNPDQWGHARVNSFITKSSGTWGKADKDLADKVRASKK